MQITDKDYLLKMFGKEPGKLYEGQTVIDEIEKAPTPDVMTLPKATMVMRLVEAALNKGGQHITVMPEGEVNIWDMDDVPVLTVDQISKWLDRVVSRVEFTDPIIDHAYMMYGWKGLLELAFKDGEFDEE